MIDGIPLPKVMKAISHILKYPQANAYDATPFAKQERE